MWQDKTCRWRGRRRGQWWVVCRRVTCGLVCAQDRGRKACGLGGVETLSWLDAGVMKDGGEMVGVNEDELRVVFGVFDSFLPLLHLLILPLYSNSVSLTDKLLMTQLASVLSSLCWVGRGQSWTPSLLTFFCSSERLLLSDFCR
ncbi:MAG: hypothetical protein ACKERG_00440 [Candidatus Hodgkinia cicadicola]